MIDLVIYHHLKDKRDFFKGTFASNELNRLRVDNLEVNTCFSFVANTLARHDANSMVHWLAFFVKISGKKVYLKFVDSFKMPYTFYGKYIKDYIDNLRYLTMKHGDMQLIFEEVPFGLQSYKSFSCGGYAVYSILGLKHCKSRTLHHLFSNFNANNKKTNDMFVEDFVVKKWPKRFCSDIFTKDVKVPFCAQKVFKRPGCLLKCFCETTNCCTNIRPDYYIRPKVKHLFSVKDL